MNLFIKDTGGEKSLTATAFVVGFIVVNVKLLISGLTLVGVQMAAFSGSEYGIAVAALGGVYVLRRTATKSNETSKACL